MIFNLQRDIHDARDLMISPPNFLTKLFLPSKIDLSSKIKITHQWGIGSCQSSAGCYLWQSESKRNYEPSRLFLYYKVRSDRGNINEDTGATVRETMKAMSSHWVSQEKFHPYIEEDIYTKPSDIATLWGKRTVITSYTRVNVDIQSIKKVLASKHMIEFGMIVTDSFMQEGWTELPIPSGNTIWGHAMTIVGYDDSKKMLKVANSWGEWFWENWFFYIPYDRINNSEFFDFWYCNIK